MDTDHAKAHRLNKLARVSGHAVLALILAGVAYTGHVVLKTKRYNAEAAAYIRDGVAAMASDWNAAELLRRASPEWLSPADHPGVERLFVQLSGLGGLKALHDPTGRTGNGAYPGTRIQGDWAAYSIAGTFDAGTCEFHMVLERTDEGWRIAGLEVVSEALASARSSR